MFAIYANETIGYIRNKVYFPPHTSHDRYYMYTILYKSLEKPNFTEATRNKHNDDNKYIHQKTILVIYEISLDAVASIADAGD